MKRIVVLLCSSLQMALVAGCGVESIDSREGETLGAAESALEDSNALNPNALNPNALNPNALNPNALNPNALNPNALNPNALQAIQAVGDSGTLSRQLLSYTVSCALSPSQSFSFSWYDTAGALHQETYWGLLGLAPTWAQSPLDSEGATWVSACLASRVNWYGIPVMLSSRGAHPNLATQTATERAGYTYEEGAFFGNLFSTSPAVYACNIGSNVTHSRLDLRDCAAGHVENGAVAECATLHILGDCADYCQALDSAGLYHPRCTATPGVEGSSTAAVVTVFLH